MPILWLVLCVAGLMGFGLSLWPLQRRFESLNGGFLAELQRVNPALYKTVTHTSVVDAHGDVAFRCWRLGLGWQRFLWSARPTGDSALDLARRKLRRFLGFELLFCLAWSSVILGVLWGVWLS